MLTQGNRCLALWMAVIVAVAAVSGGCGQKYRGSNDSIAQAYQEGQYQAAAATAVKVSADAAKRDKLILLLEEGCALRAAGRLAESNRAFEAADDLFKEFDKNAAERLKEEAVSALTSPAALDYDGYGYDRIMLQVYMAMNCLEAGERDRARTEIGRLAEAQDRCEERYQKKIAQAEKSKKEGEEKHKIDEEAVRKDEKFAAGRKTLLSEFEDVDDEPALDDQSHKALYSNPFADYLQGVFYLYSDVPGQREMGRGAFRRAAEMMQANSVVAADFKHAEGAAELGAFRARTYVFFETGMAPRREAVRIDIPVFAYNLAVSDTKVDYVGIAFPKLKKTTAAWDEALYVMSEEATCQTELLADVDLIVAREFKHEMPRIITRAVIGAVTKAAMQYGAAKATEKENIFVQLIARGSAVIYSAAMNEADLRTWRTLPKQIQVASCQTPADGTMTLKFTNGTLLPVIVQPGKANIVWVRRPSSSAQPEIRSFAVN